MQAAAEVEQIILHLQEIMQVQVVQEEEETDRLQELDLPAQQISVEAVEVVILHLVLEVTEVLVS